MIVGTGIDIAEVPRIREAIERFGQRFLGRIYTAGEIRYCDSKANRIERYAARFASKEAAMKALRYRMELRRALAGLRSHSNAWRTSDHDISWQGRRICRQARRKECCSVHFSHRRASNCAGHPRKLIREPTRVRYDDLPPTIC